MRGHPISPRRVRETPKFPAVIPASWRKQAAESFAKELKSSIFFGKDVTFMVLRIDGTGPGLEAFPIREYPENPKEDWSL